MRNYRITVQDDHKHIVKGQLRLGGINPKGEQIGFTNYFMEKDGEPFSGFVLNSIMHAMMNAIGKTKLLK